MSSKRASLKDVAACAGVGLGTASRVINGNTNVKPATQKKVLDAIQTLHYRPNNIARSLKINETHSVGILLTDLKSGFDTEIVRGIESVAHTFGYSLFLTNSNKEESKMLLCIKNFVEKNVDGIIIIGGEITEEFYADIKQFDIPLITVSCETNIVPSSRYTSITIDNEKAAYDAVSYLIQKGHKKIAMIAGEYDERNAGIPRINGYQHALSEHNIAFDPEYLVEGSYTFESGYQAALRLLEKEELPTAIFAASDTMALGAQRAVQKTGIAVPDGIALIGFDGLEFTSYVNPTLSTIVQPRYQMGKLAMNSLLRFLEGKNDIPSRQIVSHTLKIQESC